MKTFTVHHRNDGSFEAASPDDDVFYKIVQDESFGDPWVVLFKQVSTGSSCVEATFESLDEALDYAVCLALCVEESPRYRVEMTDGCAFQRPGHFVAESVLAGLGWINVRELISYHNVSGPRDMTRKAAEALVKRDLAGKSVMVGSVDLVEIDGGASHWCADISIPFNGFMPTDEIEIIAESAFLEQGLGEQKLFEWRTRIPAAPHTAEIFEFPLASKNDNSEVDADKDTAAVVS